MRAYKNVPKSEKEINEAYVQDMQAGREQAQLEAQKKEFGDWLRKEVEERLQKNIDVPEFLQAMFFKVDGGVLLTVNMENALRKWMTRSKETNNKKKSNQDKENAPILTVKIKQWFMKANHFDSRILTGKVLVETAKAYLIEGYADMVEDCTWCVRCGRPLTEPASMVIGMGEICAGNSGVPYPTNILLAPKKDRMKIRKELLKKLHDQKFECWIPKSQIEEVIKKEEPSK